MNDEYSHESDSDSNLTSLNSEDTIFQDCEPIFKQKFEKSQIEKIERKRRL